MGATHLDTYYDETPNITSSFAIQSFDSVYYLFFRFGILYRCTLFTKFRGGIGMVKLGSVRMDQ